MISEKEYIEASKVIGCEVAAVKAVCHVESGGIGFFKRSGRIVIKFEGHIFHKYTKGKFDKEHPTLSYPAWTEKFTEYGEAGYNRFNQAFHLDPHAAMMSTSWGMFQIMGFNYSTMWFKSVDEMVTSFKISEDNQVDGFCKYIRNSGLGKYLAARNWVGFAYRYNGAEYKKNDYDLLLQHEYDKFKPL